MPRITAGVFIINPENKILIAHPTGMPQTIWSIPKGKMDEGETPLQAAKRETFEEVNIDLEGCNFLTLQIVPYNNGKKVLHPFIILPRYNPHLKWDGFDLKCNSRVPVERGNFFEMDDFLFSTFEEAKSLLHYTQVACLEAIKEQL